METTCRWWGNYLSTREAVVSIVNQCSRTQIRKGSRNLTSKEDVVKYLKDAFAHAHKAIGTMTNENLLEQKRDPYVEKLRLLDAMRRQFSSHTLGITTGKWYFGGEQCVGGISTNG
jgi:hypothetical protein